MLKMKCAYQEAMQENKNVIQVVTQEVNVLRNDINSHWRLLDEEQKEKVKDDYRAFYHGYVKICNEITSAEESLKTFIENYNHCGTDPCTCKRLSDEGLELIRLVFIKTDFLKDDFLLNFKLSTFLFLDEAKRVMEEAEL